MKWRALRTVFAAVMCSVLFAPAFSQNYFFIIGAFSTESDDVGKITAYLPGQSMDTSYTLHANDDVLHFYVLKTSGKDLAIAKSKNLQANLDLKNIPVNQPLEHKLNVSGPLVNQPLDGTNALASGASKTSDPDLPSSGAVPPKPRGKYFKFSIMRDDGQTLPGEVHQVDFLRGKELRSFESGTYVDMLRPGTGQPMTLVCGVFGYKEMQKYVDYSNPSLTAGAYLDEQGAWVIPYELERLEDGDVSVMYNVSFYKDAVVMLPASQKDLDELVHLMNVNPNYVIKVHAHCNGKNRRKIIALGDDNNFFDVNGAIEIEGSAKRLTNLRGEAVRDYLAGHGIDEKRVKIFGWGGTEMLVDKNSVHSKLNDRIEIEILKD